MKCIVILLFLLYNVNLLAQNSNKLIGKYKTHFAEQIELKSDMTFKYSCFFDTASSWSKGTWSIKNDTVYFKTIPVYDTLRRISSKGEKIDSLILAGEETPKLIYTIDVTNSIFANGQNRHPIREKLFYKKEKLYSITATGKPFKKKIKGFWTKKKWHTWYFKVTDK